MSDLPVKAYLVETEHSQAVILDHARALDYAAQHHGTIEPLVRLKDVKGAEAPTQATDPAHTGWFTWLGGSPLPAPPGTKVQVKYRDGTTSHPGNLIGALDWSHDGGDCDIVAFKLC